MDREFGGILKIVCVPCLTLGSTYRTGFIEKEKREKGWNGIPGTSHTQEAGKAWKSIQVYGAEKA